MNHCEKPNFVIILADDLGYGDISCYGSQTIHTPHLDRLAAGGMRFTDFHSNGAVCSPTRAAFMTGRYQQRTGIEGVVSAARHRDKGLSLDEVTFAKLLKEQGYCSALFGKWHLGYDPKYSPLVHGFDEFIGFVAGNVDYQSHIDQVGMEDWWCGQKLTPEEGYTTDLITAHGLRFIEKHGDDPFCLYLAHEAPHYPYQGPTDPADRSLGSPEPVFGSRPDKEEAYREMIECLDANIGRIIQALNEKGLLENTLVLFWSDNGPAGYGSAGELRGSKGTVHEGGHRIPAIAYWPESITAGQLCEVPCMGMDIFPTLAALAACDMPDRTIDGVDLSSLLLEERPLPQRDLFWKHGSQMAIRRGSWKLVVDDDTDGELYDLSTDPSESINQADEHPVLVEAMHQTLKAWHEEVTRGVTQQCG